MFYNNDFSHQALRFCEDLEMGLVLLFHDDLFFLRTSGGID
jgi:hypothetical protein